MTTPAGGARRIYINREPGSTQLTLWGTIPVDDTGANEGLAIEDPAEFAATVFRHLLEVRGIAVYGKQRARHTELANLSTFTSTVIASSRGGGDNALNSPAGPLVLAEYQSAPLSQDIQVINKVSQNLHAEILLRLLGREKGTAGTVQAGLEVLRGFLNNAGISSDEYDLYDGSGLSRQNLVTPHAIVQVLRYAASQPWGAEFRDSLPVAGMDGSLADRFKDLNPAAHIYGKTGSLGGVKSLAGYAVTPKGEQIVFSVVSNNLSTPAKRVTDVIDSLVEAAVDSAK
jgi:D-alanyl-D-alanine carboxypeptidase/D-alanyl-D-alanine-endopeptidase (penicillin-binding protein 4)